MLRTENFALFSLGCTTILRGSLIQIAPCGSSPNNRLCKPEMQPSVSFLPWEGMQQISLHQRHPRNRPALSFYDIINESDWNTSTFHQDIAGLLLLPARGLPVSQECCWIQVALLHHLVPSCTKTQLLSLPVCGWAASCLCTFFLQARPAFDQFPLLPKKLCFLGMC